MNKDDLKNFIERHGLTHAQLARLLGVTDMAVNHWLSGRRSLALPMVRLLRLFDRKPELMREFAA